MVSGTTSDDSAVAGTRVDAALPQRGRQAAHAVNTATSGAGASCT
jgi:hypothetical protein